MCTLGVDVQTKSAGQVYLKSLEETVWSEHAEKLLNDLKFLHARFGVEVPVSGSAIRRALGIGKRDSGSSVQRRRNSTEPRTPGQRDL